MSTASSPSRKTMIAVLVTTAAAEVGPAPTAASESASAASSASRVAVTSSGEAFLRISCARPGSPSAPYQKRLSVRTKRSGARPRSRCSGPNSKNAYASSRACSALPYSPARLAATTRSSEVRITSKSAAAPASCHCSGKIPSARSSASFVFASTVSSATTARPWEAAARSSASEATTSSISRTAAGSRLASTLSRSANACAAPSRNVTASWISNETVTRPSATPRPYSIGTRARKRRNWPARRISSSGASGAARKPSSARSTASRARE